ncbi:hypothetical protein FHW58_005477 [Duganella sp. 1224]|uniref:hypothetical protein n=1 Tax=Duganella sp. 1224 TaxID=2587052 RepID=UPI0015CDEFA4|nr:hypothetical protein [Duganella sp. 1224]NYE64239.1 hypothetical protein [Duganella sp. 1224]
MQRLIESDELQELMRGGYSSNFTTADMPSIDVLGERWENHDYNGGSYTPSFPGGSNPGPFPDPEPCTTHSSPSPGATPQGVNLETIRDAMDYLAHQMQNRPEYSKGIEQITFMYRNSATGALRVDDITVGTGSGVNATVQSLSWDEKMIAMIHTHPQGTDGLPSSPADTQGDTSDTQQWNILAQSQTVDANFLSYILDSNTGYLYEYHGAGPLIRTIGNNMTTDLVLCT